MTAPTPSVSAVAEPPDISTESSKQDPRPARTAVSCKEQGNKLFCNQNFKQACATYQYGLELLLQDIDNDIDDETELALRSNLAMVLIKLEQWQPAEDECTAVLVKDPNHIKAWYRRSLAREGLEKWLLALDDIEKCLTLFPTKLTTPLKKMRLAAMEAKKRMQTKAIFRTMPSPTQQRADIIRLLMSRTVLDKQSPLPAGEAFFCLNWTWWSQWCAHVDFYYNQVDRNTPDEGKRQVEIIKLLPVGTVVPSTPKEDDDTDDDLDPPGAINNSALLRNTTEAFHQHWYDTTQQLAPGLVRGHHYELIPREVYFALKTWYGEVTPSICRRMNGKIQLYTPISTKNEAPTPSNEPLYKCGACRAPTAINRCRQCLYIRYCDRVCQESHWLYHKRDCQKWALQEEKPTTIPAPTGHVGLHNLGNTCFMASSLQCLSHATPLTRHFLSNQFLQDLNIANPLGTNGKLAHAYEAIIKDIWMKQPDATSPTALKRAIAMFAPRFAGCSQHDAQEFLAYLLDGLHEDLNRIRNAPYVSLPDVSGDMHFHVAGAQAWDAHHRRNDSVVMGTFYGQFKSTCVCPTCQRVSVSFDTFNHVSLEIPQLENLTRFVPIMMVNKGVNVRYLVEVSRSGFVEDLKKELSIACGISVQRLALCDVFEHTIYDILKDKKQMSTIRATDNVVAYEVDPYSSSMIHTIGTNRIVGTHRRDSGDTEGDEFAKGLFGFPFISSFPVDLTCKEVWEYIWSLVKTHVDDDHKDLLTIRFVDSNSRPRQIFLDANSDIGHSDSSTLPPFNEEKLATFFGEGCTERFLFIVLEWRHLQQGGSREDTETSNLKSIDPSKFIESTIHPSYAKVFKKQRDNSSSSQGVTLDQCFDTFTRPERLDENNMWYCSRCKEHVRAMKTMELWRLPNVLIVHLKRFEFKNALRRDKLDTFVDFPLDGLDMGKHCASTRKNGSDVVDDSVDATYDLFGVTNHYGRLGFGHYTAFARKWDEDGMSKEWALFDDSSVRSVGNGKGRNNGVVTPSAYVLFYRRRCWQ